MGLQPYGSTRKCWYKNVDFFRLPSKILSLSFREKPKPHQAITLVPTVPVVCSSIPPDGPYPAFLFPQMLRCPCLSEAPPLTLLSPPPQHNLLTFLSQLVPSCLWASGLHPLPRIYILDRKGNLPRLIIC